MEDGTVKGWIGVAGSGELVVSTLDGQYGNLEEREGQMFFVPTADSTPEDTVRWLFSPMALRAAGLECWGVSEEPH